MCTPPTFTVLAVAVLEFRATNLFKATSLSEAEVRLFGSTMPWSNQVISQHMASTKIVMCFCSLIHRQKTSLIPRPLAMVLPVDSVLFLSADSTGARTVCL